MENKSTLFFFIGWFAAILLIALVAGAYMKGQESRDLANLNHMITCMDAAAKAIPDANDVRGRSTFTKGCFEGSKNI